MSRKFILVLILLTGCGLSTAEVIPAQGAPSYAPSDRVDTLETAPTNGSELGLIRVQNNNYSSDADCTKRVMKEARKLGADSVVFIRRKSGEVIGKGPACDAKAYRRVGS